MKKEQKECLRYAFEGETDMGINSSKMIMFHVPEDKELLAAFGEVAIRHEHMSYILKMIIRTLTEVSVEEAVKATAYENISQIRTRINKIARTKLGEGEALKKLQAILSDCKCLTDKRNELTHCLWTQELDGEAQLRDPYGNTQLLPTAQDLFNLAKSIEEVTKRINYERFEGFLYQALSQKGV